MKASKNLMAGGAAMAGATLAYFLAGSLGLAMAFLHSSASPVWPASGLALAILLLFGVRLWPAVALGAFLVNLDLTGHPLSSLGIALGNTAEAVAAAWLIRRFAGGVSAFDRPATLARYLAAAAGACALSASIGMATLLLFDMASWAGSGPIWLTWWAGDFISLCSFAPFLILWGRERRLRTTPARLLEAALAAAAVFSAGWLLFGRSVPVMAYGLPTEFLELPPLLWAAFRFGQKGAMGAVQILAGLAVWGTVNGRGPFASGDANASLLQLQFFIGVLSATTLLLTAVLASMRKAEAGLQASEERFRQLTESIREVFYVTEPEWPGIAYVSPAYETVWGRKRADLYADPTSILRSIHPDDRPRFAEALARQMGGEETAVDYRIVRPDGSQRWIHDRSFLVKDAGGRVVKVNGVAADITDRRQAEEKLRTMEDQLRHAQKMEAVGRLAGGIAHDFNNLLTAVNGYAELLLGRMAADHPHQPLVREILAAGERGAAVTQQLLAFSRKQITAPVTLDVNGVIMNLQKMLGRLLGAVTPVEFRLGQGLPHAKADSGQIGQAVMNLVLNAKDAMPGGGRVTVETGVETLTGEEPDYYLKSAPGTYVRIDVRDEGKGMDDAVKSHLFEPYFTTKEKGKGTGLGLSTVYGIIEHMGGGIRVETSPRGSCFRLYLKAAPVEAPGEAKPEAVPAAAPRRRGTILLVEDEESVRRLVKLTLTSQGFRVFEATGERDALRLQERYRGPIHLLLTDVVLPGRSGREVAKAFAALRPGIRILFMSGYSEDPLLRQSLEKTGALFLGKPFSPGQLLEKVQEALERGSAAEPAEMPQPVQSRE